MRFLALVVGMTAATCATAGEFDSPVRDTDALTAQFVYEARFGGAMGAPVASALRFQVANEGQRLAGVAPLQAEFRPVSGQFFVNGMNVERVLIARQFEEPASSLPAILPLAIVLGAAGLILVDGYDQFDAEGTGGSGN